MSKLNDSTLKIFKKYRLDTDMSVFGDENKEALMPITLPEELGLLKDKLWCNKGSISNSFTLPNINNELNITEV